MTAYGKYEDFPAERYLDYIAEHVEPWTYLKFPYYKKAGAFSMAQDKPVGIYRTNALARINVCRRNCSYCAGSSYGRAKDLPAGARGDRLMEAVNFIPEYCHKPTLILGCGNVLLGDDGFGPEVIAYLRAHYPIPEDVALVDAGTGVGEILIDLALSDKKPKKIILVDALDGGQPAGTISVRSLDSLPQSSQRGRRDFSSHQAPTSCLLKELEALSKVEVILLTVQPHQLSRDVQPGLSPPLQEAVPWACEFIARRFFCHAREPYRY